jgi:hypothetical protein
LEDRSNQEKRELHKALKLVADVETGDVWSSWGMCVIRMDQAREAK